MGIQPYGRFAQSAELAEQVWRCRFRCSCGSGSRLRLLPSAAAMAAFKRTPVLIVTGYAAAGKTTLTNLLLGECRASAGRVGVIAHRQVEEYGIAPHPIDETGVVECDEVYDFGSGCLCCSPSGELTRLLSAWAERLLEGSLTLDLLLLKAAPLASPLVFARCIACASGALADAFQLASIVAVVSPRLAPRHLADRSPEWQAG